jgi:putative ABC transport system permease protein
VTRVDVDAALVLKAIALGSGATLVAAALPALEATRTPPRAVMYRSDIETRVLRWVPLLRHFAYGGFALSALLLAWPSRSVTLSFAALFILVLSFALWSPTGVRVLTRWLRHFAAAGFGLFGSIAVNSVERNLSRTALAIAALMVCVATTFGVATMISSFRAAVSVWIGDTLRADLYVSKPATGYNPLTLALADEFIEHVAGLPEIDTLSLGRRATLVDTDTRTELLILEVPRRGFAGFRLREGNAETAWAAFSEGSGVLISEPYAYRHSLHVGDTVQLRAGAGEVRFPIAGVYTDYASEQGTVVMHRNTYRRHWGESLVTTLGVYLKPGADADAVMQRIRSLAAPDQSLLIRSNQAIREHTLQIFDQTFAITEVLRVLTILVACVGILTALMAVQLERAREFGVLRATGVTPAQLRITVIAETALMGLIAGILALPLGLLLSALLVFVINRRSFGWSMDLQFDLAQVGAALLLALVAATAAGIYPAEKMARSSPAAALRDE